MTFKLVRSSWWKWLVLATFVVVAFAWLGLAAEHLFLGWLYFPVRVLPRASVDGPAMIVGLVSLAAFILGVHITARWFLHATSPAEGSARQWSWRSTAALSLTILLLFTAGTAMVGAAHQLVWLITGREKEPSAQSEPVLGLLETARESTRQMRESYDLKQMGMGIANYHDTLAALPPGGTMNAEGELLHGWGSYLAPYLNYSLDIDYAVPWNKTPNARFFQCNLSLFVNASLPGPYFDPSGYGYSHVAGNVHVLPIRQVEVRPSKHASEPGDSLAQMREKSQLIALSDITDGTSQTLLFGTVAERFKPWGHPTNVRDPASGIDRSPDGFGGPPAWGGAQFAMCDSSVRFMSNKTDPRVLQQLATPSGGEAVEVP